MPSIYPQVIGGTEVFNFYLIQELGKTQSVSYLNVDKEPHIKLENAYRYTIKNTKQFFQLLQIINFLVRKRKNYDLIWTSFSKTAWYYIVIYPILNLLFRKEYLIVIHGGGLMPWIWKLPYKFYFKRAKAVIGVSERICIEYNKRTGIKILHIPPLIPFNLSNKSKEQLRSSHQIDDKSKVFLFVGSIKSLKGPDTVYSAFRSLGKEYLERYDIQVIFAGDGPMKANLQDQCYADGLGDIIKFKGNVPREQIHEWYKLSDFYIIASDFEGTPIAMMEAMYNQLPVIASDVQGINNIINDKNGILFKNKDVEDLKRAIDKILTDPQFTAHIAYQSHQYFMKTFNYQSLIEKYKKIYA